ncbi:pimeloyl-ACP methyl ester carboxylesterase [Oxalobacteraceae bacterium GrIS 1.11]
MPFLDLNSAERLYYETIAGQAGRPCLVFLHEGLGCVAMWKQFPAMVCLASGCSGLVYDRPGYGKSGPPCAAPSIDYLHEQALCALPQVIAQLIPGQEHVLIGHSDGGSIALIYASRRPAHLLAMVTVAAHVMVEAQTVAGIRAAVAAFKAGKLGALSRYHGARTEAMFKAWATTWLGDAFQDWNIASLLPSIRCAALIVQGLDDQYGSAAQVEVIAGQVLGAHKAMLDGCGHAPHLEQPERLTALMAGFLRSIMPADYLQTASSCPATGRPAG